jgi:hypothetical protein
MNAHGVVRAVNDMYAYLHALNRASIDHGYNRLEDLMQPAGFSGLLSNVFVRSIARQFGTSVPGLAINMHHNGRPDLVPRAVYPGDAILRGEQGVEVKVVRSRSVQGHNRETGWVLIIQIGIDTVTEPIYDRQPTVVERVMVALLDETDWAFSGRSETSRRTPTASINAIGYAKLEQGSAYVRAGYAPRPPRVRKTAGAPRPRRRRASVPPAEP